MLNQKGGILMEEKLTLGQFATLLQAGQKVHVNGEAVKGCGTGKIWVKHVTADVHKAVSGMIQCNSGNRDSVFDTYPKQVLFKSFTINLSRVKKGKQSLRILDFNKKPV